MTNKNSSQGGHFKGRRGRSQGMPIYQMCRGIRHVFINCLHHFDRNCSGPEKHFNQNPLVFLPFLVL